MINDELSKLLKKHKIDYQESLKILVAIKNKLTFQENATFRLLCGHSIISYNYGTNNWDILYPLYKDEEVIEETDYGLKLKELFKSINPSRGGNIHVIRKRLSDVPHSPLEVFQAAQNYIKQLEDPRFLFKSFKFIWREPNKGIREYPYQDYLSKPISKKYDIG